MPRDTGGGPASSELTLSDPADSDDVVWNFLAAELDSPRWRARLEAVLPPVVVERLRTSSRDHLPSEELASARRALLAHRGRFVEFLLDASTNWRYGRLPTARLETLRVIAEGDFLERAPTRLLGEFARRTDEGVPPIPDFDPGYRTLRSGFDRNAMRGIPILLGASERGPFTIAEGLTRLTCLASLRREGRPVPEGLEILVGTNAGLARWGWA